MAKLFKIYEQLECGKHVFLHYSGAIREAIFNGIVIMLDYGQKETRIILNIAGIGEKSIGIVNALYYSEIDAIEEVNNIEQKLISIEGLNKITPARIDDYGNVYAYHWNKTHACEERIYYGVAVYISEKVSFVKPPRKYDYSLSQTTYFPPTDYLPISDGYYKTKKECKANNRPEIVRF